MPGRRAAAAVEADMAAALGKQRCQEGVAGPVVAQIGRDRNPGIVLGMDDQGRRSDGRQELLGAVDRVIIVGGTEAVAPGDEDVIECVDAAGGHGGLAFLVRDSGTAMGAFDLHAIEHVVVIEAVARPHDTALCRLQVDRRRYGNRGAQRRGFAGFAEILQQHVAAQRVTDGNHAIGRQIGSQLVQHQSQIFAAAGMVFLPAPQP